MAKKVIGIDLGTTFTVVAIAQPKVDHGVQINSIENRQGKLMTASSVTFIP